MRNRVLYIDNLKAFAISLVVIGHVLQYIILKDTYKESIAFNFIYSFHMALFMMISGYVMGHIAKSKTWDFNRIIKKRAIQLLLPFLSWTIIYAIVQRDPIHVVESVIYPAKSLWFLWALFCITVAFSIIRNATKAKWPAIWGGYFCLF